MTPAEFAKLEAAFAEARDLAGAEREAYLEQFARENPDLAAELRALIQADEEPVSELTYVVGQSISSAASEYPDPWLGRKIGAWTIRDRLGQGGMGAVFLAERADGEYDQTAALKIINLRQVNTKTIARFRNERQILANLSHPNIARLIDGGSESGDLPYLVMEYIDGTRIDRHCDENRLGVSARLRLFCKVCAAVDFAHRRLVVHRDIKPSNILIDGNGEPQLLDFGIAKLIEPDDNAATGEQTAEMAQALTPEYASPEQVRGEPVTIASDVYALGVLLYRLLSGASPYGEHKNALELQNAILDVDPSLPSAALTLSDATSNGATPETIADQRGLSAAELRTRLKGDLDNIILKCLQKDPERRYSSARDLERDLERFLNDQPVSAGRDDMVYRLQKFVKRNTLGVALGSAALALTVGGTSYHTFQLSAERDRAEREAETARQVSAFMTNVFRSSDPFEVRGDTITALELLENAQEDIALLEDQPEVQARLLHVLGQTYKGLGDYPLALEMLQRSLTLTRQVVPDNQAEIAQLLHDMGEATRLNRDLDAAHDYFAQALEIRQAILPGDATELIDSYTRLGVTAHDAREYDEALEYLLQAQDLLEQRGESRTPEAIDLMGNIGIVLLGARRYDEAEPVLRETTLLSDRLEGELDPNSIIRLDNLGLVFSAMSRPDEAELIYREVVRRAEEVWPDNHPNQARYLEHLARSLERQGKMDEAEDYYLQTAQSAARAAGEVSPAYADALGSLGIFQSSAGKLAASADSLQRAQDLWIQLNGPDDPEALRLAVYAARLTLLRGNPAAARTALEAALERSDDLSMSMRFNARRDLANALSQLGQTARAGDMLDELLEEALAYDGEVTPRTLRIQTVRSANLRRSGDAAAAVQIMREAVADARARFDDENWNVAMVAAELALGLAAVGELAEARAVGVPALQVLSSQLPESDPRVRPLATLLRS